jgi:phospholipase/carboxylesterase
MFFRSSIVGMEHTRFRASSAQRFVLGALGNSSYCRAMSALELAGLNVHVSGNPESAGASPLVILLHGYGAPGTDLVVLADEIAAPAGTVFLFPEAPIELAGNAMPGNDARAWWPIDVARVQLSMLAGKFDDAAILLRPGLASATEQVSALVSAASHRFGTSLDRIVLGGFSQGAIVGLEAALKHGWHLGGLLLFSGSLMDSKGLCDRAQEIAPMACVVSHGHLDPILPFALADRLQSELTRAGWDVDWVPFVGGHGIPPKATVAAGRLVTRQLA